MPQLSIQLEVSSLYEAYRQKITFMLARLRRTIAHNKAAHEAEQAAIKAGLPPSLAGSGSAANAQRDYAYYYPYELLADLVTIETSLRENKGNRLADGAVSDLMWQVQTFGFHLAGLEVRQHSAKHAAALAEVLAKAGVCNDYLVLDEEAKFALLEKELASPALCCFMVKATLFIPSHPIAPKR